MQFCKGGPDVPDRLIQAHEDGRVVFFCGAGISYPAGLPGFKGLIEKLCETLSPDHDPELQKAIETQKYDTAIGILEDGEDGIVGGRQRVRAALTEILAVSPCTRTDTHAALLTLGRTLDRKPEHRTHLVTTNFDRLFENTIRAGALAIRRFQAPALPVPKGLWDGLVYLHGLLPTPDGQGATALNDLVVSSGDFGRAYLNEGWAARFVAELFRNYHVCFVGYSLDDPILRYMTDALAADRTLGEQPLEMFAFGSFSETDENDRKREWETKGVTPILYNESGGHQYLHHTLQRWASIYRDGVNGKEAIINEYAHLHPSQSTKEDDFSGLLLWALSDTSGLPAKRFAELETTPHLEWRSRIFESGSQREKTLTRQPHDVGDWNPVVQHLASWLTRHLDNNDLLFWLANLGRIIDPQFAAMIKDKLHDLKVRSEIRTLWQLFLAGYMKYPTANSYHLTIWERSFNTESLTVALRKQFRDLLSPRIILRPSIPELEVSQTDSLAGDIVLGTDDLYASLQNLRGNEAWVRALPDLLYDLDGLLREVMDLKRELGDADDNHDWSYVWLPSITTHPQNENLADWTILVELIRDAWSEVARQTPARARRMAEDWCDRRYPVFRRLAFFAAARDGPVPPSQALDWLLDDGHWWLWSVESRREAMRLLMWLTPRLDAEGMNTLERAVMNGPPVKPVNMYSDDVDPDFKQREVWLRLAKIVAAGGGLGPTASERLAEMQSDHPDWTLADDESDEFPLWSEPIGSLSGHWKLPPSPPRRRGLVEWLRQHPKRGDWTDDDWARRCREHFPVASCALCALARDGIWPEDRWREALYAWSEDRLGGRSWRYMAPVLAAASDDLLRSGTFSRGLTHWLTAVAREVDSHEDLFLGLCERVLKLEAEDDGDGDTDSPVTAAINHPVGKVVEALLDWWFKRRPVDGQGLPEKIEPLFTHVCATPNAAQRHGRVILASRGIALFRVDRSWTETHLLPYFDWQRCEAEARAAWEGFCWSPRLYPPLIEALGGAFLKTARRHAKWGRHTATNYPVLLTYAALEGGDLFKEADLKEATRRLPPDNALVKVAQTLRGALEGAGDRRNEYWKNRARPYLQKIWPQSRDRRTFAISEALGRVCIAAGDSFPDALNTLDPWLQPLRYPDRLAGDLLHASLCQQFPREALDFLNSIFRERLQIGSPYLPKCLETIRTADASLEDDRKFRRLLDLSRSHSV